jgi:hypothetical protein
MLAVGALVGAVAVGWHVVARLVGAKAVDDVVWRSDAYRLSLGQGTIFLLTAAAVVGAVACALVLPRRWWPLGIVGGAVALAVGTTGVLLANMATGCGLLPRAGPPDCAPPGLGELDTFGARPLGFAVVWVAVVAATVGVVRGLPGRTVSAEADRPHAARTVLASVAAAVVASVLGLGVVGTVAATDIPTVQGPGYVLELPPTWLATPTDDGVPLLSTVNQRVRVNLSPIPETLPAQGPETLLVGGVEAWLVAEQAEGQLVIRAYDLSAPAGPYRLLVLGSPEALDAAVDHELADLLDGIQWAGP